MAVGTVEFDLSMVSPESGRYLTANAYTVEGVTNADGSLRVFTEKPATYKEVPLGQGQVPWDGYLAALRKAGFDGFLTIERECGSDREGDIRQAVEFLKSKLA